MHLHSFFILEYLRICHTRRGAKLYLCAPRKYFGGGGQVLHFPLTITHNGICVYTRWKIIYFSARLGDTKCSLSYVSYGGLEVG